MSTLYSGSICVSDINKSKLTQAKNGKLYLSVDIWINDQADQYGNTGSISIRQSKEEREAKTKKVYIGNLKPVEKSNDTPSAQAIDPLPF
jgi:hypothetical protein